MARNAALTGVQKSAAEPGGWLRRAEPARPEVITRLLCRNDARGTVSALTERERDVLQLMAEGRSNSAIAAELHVSDSAVTKHIASIFGKLDLAPSTDDNRRVLAVLAYLNQ